MHLRDVGARLGPARFADVLETQVRRCRIVQTLIAVFGTRAGQFLGIVPFFYPGGTDRAQPFFQIDGDSRVGLYAGSIVNINGRIFLGAEMGGRIRQMDLAHGNLDVGSAALHINFLGGRIRIDFYATDGVGGQLFKNSAHCFSPTTNKQGAGKFGLSYAGISRIRFKGFLSAT